MAFYIAACQTTNLYNWQSQDANILVFTSKTNYNWNVTIMFDYLHVYQLITQDIN